MANEETTEAESKETPPEEVPAAPVATDAAVADASEPPPSEPAPSPRPPRRFASAFALGFSLAGEGFLAKASMVLAALTTIGALVFAVAMASEDSPPLASLPGLTASALGWGAGFVFAVAAAARAFDRDASNGVRMLVRTRGISLGTYAIGRVFGLAVALALMVGVGSLITGGVCAALAHGSRLLVLRATIASLAYAVAFGFLLAPLAAATLGARARGRGYMILIALLIVPEGLQDSLDSLPERWRSLFGIPSAMSSLRDAISPGRIDLPLAAAALIVIVIISFIAMLFAVEQALRATRNAESQ